jgi:hypothetical protein
MEPLLPEQLSVEKGYNLPEGRNGYIIYYKDLYLSQRLQVQAIWRINPLNSRLA